ncbi:cysteine-rich KTR domain-containing protein [Paenibacillus tuaregi]|nr:cysteine-rich KTR domain-containing protein [Paenibacillus tuaregi]
MRISNSIWEVNITDWIRCPVCGNKTRDSIKEETL